MSRLCGEVSPPKSPDVSAKNRDGRLLGSAAPGNNTPCIRAKVRRIPAANDLESFRMRLPRHSKNWIPSHKSRRRPSWGNSWKPSSHARSSPRSGVGRLRTEMAGAAGSSLKPQSRYRPPPGWKTPCLRRRIYSFAGFLPLATYLLPLEPFIRSSLVSSDNSPHA